VHDHSVSEEPDGRVEARMHAREVVLVEQIATGHTPHRAPVSRPATTLAGHHDPRDAEQPGDRLSPARPVAVG
jgi:hypothetical protein